MKIKMVVRSVIYDTCEARAAAAVGPPAAAAVCCVLLLSRSEAEPCTAELVRR